MPAGNASEGTFGRFLKNFRFDFGGRCALRRVTWALGFSASVASFGRTCPKVRCAEEVADAKRVRWMSE